MGIGSPNMFIISCEGQIIAREKESERMWGMPCLQASHSHDDGGGSSLTLTLTPRVTHVLLSFESYSETTLCGSEMHLLFIKQKTAMSQPNSGGKKNH